MPIFRKIAILGALSLTMIAVGLPAAGSAGATTTDAACTEPPSAASFAWALDPNLYFRMPGGGFEDGGATWSLTGGAKVVGGVQEPILPASPTDSHALELPSGSAAQSASLCVDGTATVMRFFARSEGLAGIAIVTVTATDADGNSETLLSPALPLTSSWSAPLLLFKLPLLSNGFTSMTINVHSIGLGGIDVDDVFIDPLRQR